ncbi:MAG: TonB-dependent receptor [Verrucomicrobia bacterium]|nr:TonB-dependent receptor [Verrucomicrobiota bacterium]
MRPRSLLTATLLLTAPLWPLTAAERFADIALYNDGEIVAMDKFEVIGTQTASVVASVQKLPTTVKDTPRSLSVIDSTRMREQDFQVGSDLLFWIPGINTNGAVQESYHFYARGYRMGPNDWRVDGFSGRVLGGSYSPNLFGYEQVVALKGPAGLLYGTAASPGGLINLITKKPQENAAISVDTRTRTFAGDDSGFGDRVSTEVELDATGSLTRNSRLLYRLLASVEQSALPYDGQTDANQFFRLSFTYKLDRAARFQLTPIFEWSEETRAARNAVISPASSRTTADGRTDYTTTDVSPRNINLAAGERVDRNQTLGADLAMNLSENWKANLSVRQHQRDMNNSAWSIQTATLVQTELTNPHSWVISRRHARSKSDVGTFSYDANTAYQFLTTTAVKSRLQLGLNGRLTENQAYTFATSNLNQSPINIYSGIASSELVADVPTSYTLGNLTRTDVWNAYAQSQTEFWDKLIATVGFASATEKTRTITPAGATTFSPKRSSDLTPNLGLVYRLTKETSLYASYSSSYALVDPLAEDIAGNTGNFDPTEGDNYEIGLKGDFFKRRISAGITAFVTELNNVLVQSEATELNAKGNRFYRQLDTGRKSEGIEAELVFRPVPIWETSATYTYLDAYNRTTTGGKGAPAEMTPHHAVSVYSRYTFASGPLSQWSVRLGYIRQSDRVGGSSSPTATAPDPMILRSFHRFDAGISRRWTHWNVALNIENLTDEYYLLSGSTGVAMSPVNPRSLALRVGYSW